MQIFLTKFLFSCTKKNEIFKILKRFAFFYNMCFILGDFRSNACSYFFHFCICIANFVFFRDHGPLTNVKISKFGNFENHAILDQIRLVTSSTTMILKDKSFDIKIAKI